MNKSAFCYLVFFCCFLIRCTNSNMTGNIEDGDMPEGLTVMSGECLPDVEDKYVYSIVPGTEEWNSASEEEKNSLSQLPEDRIKTLSSYALIRSLLDRPRLSLAYALSSNSSPVVTCDRFIFSQHNSVPEFEERKDRVKALMSYYAAVSCNCYESLDVEAQMTFDIQLRVLEVWFIRDAILHAMNSVEKRQTVTLLLQKHEQKQSYSDATLVAMAWIMYEDRYSPVVEYYKDITFSKEYSSFLRDDIIAFAKNYSQLN